MRFIDEDQEVIREIVEERIRRLAGFAAGEVARIVFDARAVAHFFHHFHIVARALFQTLCFQEMAAVLEDLQAFIQFLTDRPQGPFHLVLRGDIVAGRVNGDVLAFGNDFAGKDVDFRQPVDFVAEHFDADDGLVEGSREDFDRISVDAEGAAFKIHVVAAVLDIDELMQDFFLRFFLAQAQGDDEFAVIFRVA